MLWITTPPSESLSASGGVCIVSCFCCWGTTCYLIVATVTVGTLGQIRCDFFLVCRVFYVTRTQNRIDSFAGNQSIITVQPHRSQLVQHIQQGFQIGYCNCYPTTDWARLVYATRHRFPRSLATAPVATERRSSFGQRASVTSWSVFVCVHVWHVLSSVYMLVCMLWTVTAYGPVSFRAAYLFACQPKRCYRSKAARQQNQQHRSDRMYINT